MLVLAMGWDRPRREPYEREQIRSALFTLMGLTKGPGGCWHRQGRWPTTCSPGRRSNDRGVINRGGEPGGGDRRREEMYAKLMAVSQKAETDPGLQEEALHTTAELLSIRRW